MIFPIFLIPLCNTTMYDELLLRFEFFTYSTSDVSWKKNSSYKGGEDFNQHQCSL